MATQAEQNVKMALQAAMTNANDALGLGLCQLRDFAEQCTGGPMVIPIEITLTGTGVTLSGSMPRAAGSGAVWGQHVLRWEDLAGQDHIRGILDAAAARLRWELGRAAAL